MVPAVLARSSTQRRSNCFLITSLIVPGIVGAVTAVWFTCGGVRDMLRLFRDLRNRKEVDALDDGRVEGHVSLAAKKAFEAIESRRSSGRIE
ncbi:MAG: hypothetical protein IJU70_14530 [Lentisphaeria bacterium]|nr:hypothetical protein [Lentisphaeria bacterium]